MSIVLDIVLRSRGVSRKIIEFRRRPESYAQATSQKPTWPSYCFQRKVSMPFTLHSMRLLDIPSFPALPISMLYGVLSCCMSPTDQGDLLGAILLPMCPNTTVMPPLRPYTLFLILTFICIDPDFCSRWASHTS